MHDTSVVHGVSTTQARKSTWTTVNTATKCPKLAIKFLATRREQHEVAEGFLKKQSVQMARWHG